MNTRLATAPCSWGVEDPDNPNNPYWETVLEEAAASGFVGTELGPLGFMPVDPAVIADALAGNGLSLVAGTLYDDLLTAGKFPEVMEKATAVCRLLAGIPASGSDPSYRQRYLVIIDSVKPLRNHTAGQPDRAPRLDTGEWKRMMYHIEEISRTVAGEYGIRPVVHPHAGGYLEFDDETQHFLNDIPGEISGLCLDTGHLLYSGVAPDSGILRYARRLDYLHCKDIKADTYTRAISERMGFFEACLEGVMCPVGSGQVDYDAVKQALETVGYQGWITVEQERDPSLSTGTLQDLRKSHGYLSALGL